MPSFMMVEVARLVEPLNPQRAETLLDRIDELRASIHDNGLQQPIGVLALADGNYRIIWGHRRSIAVTQLKWQFVPAMVYQPGEASEDQLMGAENYHRNSTSDAEEARYYARILPNYAEGTIGIAKQLNVPQTRIERLLGVLEGNPQVWQALEKQQISLAQAHEINQFKSSGYQLQALERAIVEGTNSTMLSKWRRELKRLDMDRPDAPVDPNWDEKIQIAPVEPTEPCQIGNHDVRLLDSRIYRICNPHYNVIVEGLELLGAYRTIEESGLLPKYKALLREAEGLLNGGGQTIRPEHAEGGA